MPKGFSKKEKELIRKRLIKAGKEIFSRQGFKKTSIDEIIRLVNISKGAFYLFFQSKEVFFFEVLENMEDEFRASLSIVVENKALSPEKRLKEYFLKCFDFMESNSLLLKTKYQEMESLMANLPEEKLKTHMNRDMDFIADYINKQNTDSNQAIPADNKALKGFYLFLFYIFLHKKDIGESEYHAGIDLLLEMACSYFFSNSKKI